MLTKFTQSSEVIEQNAKLECPVVTGRLQQSIQRSVEVNGDIMKSTISANTPYAWMVEMGTSKMAPRAFLRRGLAGSISTIQNIFRRNESF
jgi:HK97 gp10 family phage protein